jgi:hypothetical protein
MSKAMLGTPKSLNEAIRNANGGQAMDAQQMEAHIRDFLSQKFSIALIKAKEGEDAAIAELWTAITGRKI